MNILEKSEALYRKLQDCSNVLRNIPGVGSGAMNLTPDHVKTMPEYQAARKCVDAALSAYQRFNKKHQKELNRLRREQQDVKRRAQISISSKRK